MFEGLVLRPATRGAKRTKSPLAVILPSGVFWIVVYFIIFNIFLLFPKRTITPLKIFLPHRGWFLVALLVAQIGVSVFLIFVSFLEVTLDYTLCQPASLYSSVLLVLVIFKSFSFPTHNRVEWIYLNVFDFNLRCCNACLWVWKQPWKWFWPASP